MPIDRFNKAKTSSPSLGHDCWFWPNQRWYKSIKSSV